MKYFLVLLGDAPDGPPSPTADSHEQFIDSLITSNSVILGGGFATALNGSFAGYVLSAEDLATATALAHEDPLVRDAHARCDVTEWRLIGINTAAIDPTQTLQP
jgi:hypothetical protein